MRCFGLRCAASLGAVLCLYAQEYRATITGTITDSSGASAPGAQVSAINLQTGLVLNSESNAQGHYVIPYLLPGQYKLRVERTGFKTFEQAPFELRVSDRIEVNAVLQVGQVSDKITVTAEVPLVETETGSRGQVIDNQRINDLPSNGRNPLQFVGLATGVQFAGSTLTYFRSLTVNGALFGMRSGKYESVPSLKRKNLRPLDESVSA